MKIQLHWMHPHESIIKMLIFGAKVTSACREEPGLHIWVVFEFGLSSDNGLTNDKSGDNLRDLNKWKYTPVFNYKAMEVYLSDSVKVGRKKEAKIWPETQTSVSKLYSTNHIKTSKP